MKERPNQFERRTWRYMLMRIVLSAVFTILNLFINTFLLKSFGNFSSELISYQVIFRAAQPVGVFCALLISSRGMPVVAQVLGLVMYLISLGLTGYEGDQFKVYHRLYDVQNITVISDKNTVGYYDMDSKVTVKDV